MVGSGKRSLAHHAPVAEQEHKPDLQAPTPFPSPLAPSFICTDFTLCIIYIFILNCSYAPELLRPWGFKERLRKNISIAVVTYSTNYNPLLLQRGELRSTFFIWLVAVPVVLLWSPLILLSPSLWVPRERAIAALRLPGAAALLLHCSLQADSRPQRYAFYGHSTSNQSDKEHAESCTNPRRY